eukprot:TRINITY_DN17335_c0_g1_i1.p1 TRINITY_DN17335_c0_g1~~TRINITY_DN17335_c0_g1_i1.p1  ORF type:complete len:340 (-),score=59.58 TRINITY_DN17335_c0_g1_i1:183-1202(-)
MKATPRPETLSDLYQRFCHELRAPRVRLFEDKAKSNQVSFDFDSIREKQWTPMLLSIHHCSIIVSMSVFSSSRMHAEGYHDVLALPRKEKRTIYMTQASSLLCRSISENMCHNTVLTTLEIIGIPLHPESIAHLAKGLVFSQSLRTLSLNNCCIGDRGLSVIHEAIISSKSLNTIRLAGCQLTDESGLKIAGIIQMQNERRHESLWIGGFRRGESNLSVPQRIGIGISKELSDWHESWDLHALDLSHNQLTDAFLFAISKHVRESFVLKAFQLRDNFFTTLGYELFLQALAHQSRVTYCDFGDAKTLESHIHQELQRILVRNTRSVHSQLYEEEVNHLN